MKSNLKTADYVTLLRLPLALVFIISLFSYGIFSALIIIIIAIITDLLDGYIARKFKQENEFGKKLDSVCDKIFMVTVVFTLSGFYSINILFPFIILFRDLSFLIGGLATYFGLNPEILKRKIIPVFSPIKSSKLLTGLQFLFVFLLLLGIGDMYVFMALLSLIFVVTVYVFIVYYKKLN